MDITREIYWNIGNSAEVRMSMFLLVLIAVAIFLWGAYQRLRVYRQAHTFNRTDKPSQRLVRLFSNTILQTRVMASSGAGLVHSLFFWGFLILFLGTCLIALQEYLTEPLWGIRFLAGTPYKYYSLLLDIAGLISLLMLAALSVRRYLIRPAGLVSQPDDAIIHGLLMAILVTGFLLEGIRMTITEQGSSLANWSPVGLVFTGMMSGADEFVLRNLHISVWWTHLILSTTFILLLPFTKLRHIFTASANYFFDDLEEKGRLNLLNFEDEQVESYGATKVTELSWKDLLDADACTQCKRCQDQCPAYATDKPLSPMKMMMQIREIAFGNPDDELIEAISKEAIWACTTCRACQKTCPTSIEHVRKLIDMRRNMVLMNGEFPGDEVVAAIQNIETNGNPFGFNYLTRGDWAQHLGVKPLHEEPDADILYFVGCYASFDNRNIRVATSFVKLCHSAGIKVGILGREERCCGDPVRKLGNEYQFQILAQKNIETIRNSNIKKIITTCPHCFNTLTKDYLDCGLNIPVEHHTVFLNELVARKSLSFDAREFDCTHHDSCYLGRYNDVYEPPRSLLKSIGGRIVEMNNNHRHSFCCGAGGGRILAEECLGEPINVKRVTMAVDTGVDIVATNCPFCLSMFEDGIKTTVKEERFKARDIAELLCERLSIQNRGIQLNSPPERTSAERILP